MSVSPPPAPSPSLATRVIWFWLGLLGFGAPLLGLTFLVAGLVAGGGAAQAVVAVLVAVAAGVAGVLLLRRGRVELGSGVLAGYALATLASGGQCTFLTRSQDYGFLGGLFIYVAALGVVLVLFIVALVVDAVRGR